MINSSAIAFGSARGNRVEATRTGDEAALDLRQAEGDVLDRHDQVAGERNLGAACQRKAVDRGDPGFCARLVHETGEAFSSPAKAAGGIRRSLPFGAAAERLVARAGEDHHPDAWILLGVEHRALETLRDVAIDRVARIGTVDRDLHDMLGHLSGENGVVFHLVSSLGGHRSPGGKASQRPSWNRLEGETNPRISMPGSPS